MLYKGKIHYNIIINKVEIVYGQKKTQYISMICLFIYK